MAHGHMKRLVGSLRAALHAHGSLREWFFVSGLDVVCVLVATFCVTVYWQLHTSIGDPDGFYHAKIALLLKEGIILKDMPWMHVSTLREAFTDHHFLYHVLLVPFVAVGKPLLGVKLATVTFSALFFTALYWFLKRSNVAAPFLWVLFLVVCSPFTFRLALVKANSVSLIALLFILFALFERRRALLFVLSGVYVLLYGGWLLSLVVVAAYIAGVMLERQFQKKNEPWYRRLFRRGVSRERLFTLAAIACGGSLAGIIVNPYFPQNLYFYWQQVWQIAIVNQGAQNVNVGGEWSSLPPAEFVAFYAFIPAVFIIGLFLLMANTHRVTRRSWMLLLLSLLTLVFTVKSRRYIELSAPFTVLFAAFVWSEVMPRKIFKEMLSVWHGHRAWVKDHLIAAAALACAVFFLLPNVGAFAQIQSTRAQIKDSISLDRYAAAARWLRENTPRGSVVLHSDWDDWPMLFYHNDWNYYIVGLDPTFMYNVSSAIYHTYADLTGSGISDDIVRTVTQDFGAQYVFIEKDHTALQEKIAGSIYFRLVYEDDEAWVYQYRP